MIRPDFREIKHSELYHYGVSRRNGAPGPGSGRYPLGSGKEPFQGIVKRIQRNNYNYKTSDAYKNGSDETKKSLNKLHRSLSGSLVSGKSRNRVEYDIIEKGVDKAEALKKEIRSRKIKYYTTIVGSNVLFFGTKYGLSLYKNLSAKMKLGNMVIDQYAYDNGLKYYESKIPTMGLKNIILGDKLYKNLRE